MNSHCCVLSTESRMLFSWSRIKVSQGKKKTDPSEDQPVLGQLSPPTVMIPTFLS